MQEIATEFINQYKTKKKILTAIVTTANGIDEVTRKKVMEIVKGTSSSEVVLEEKIDKNIIGGFIIRVGDKQMDASIARKLNSLKRTFKICTATNRCSTENLFSDYFKKITRSPITIAKNAAPSTRAAVKIMFERMSLIASG